ncbi:MAG TPA: hypothetical protein VFS62_16325 [Chloroflexota bacterium]|nr:hypothetical protein [Chloroflexota bacterium]
MFQPTVRGERHQRLLPNPFELGRQPLQFAELVWRGPGGVRQVAELFHDVLDLTREPVQLHHVVALDGKQLGAAQVHQTACQGEDGAIGHDLRSARRVKTA